MEFLKKSGWFQGHNGRFPKYLHYKLKFQKIETGFCWSKALITMTLISSRHWKTLVLFFLIKKRPKSMILTLIVNCTEKQIMSPKTAINWLFNDIWCYLFIACFDWKICVFQQTVISVYYILKCCCLIFLMVDSRPIYSNMENKMIRVLS